MSLPRSTDIRVTAADLYLLPVQTRMPLKFGPEVLTEVTCARVRMTVRLKDGREASGWGETPLNVQWAWPSSLTYAARHDRMVDFCRLIATAWADFDGTGHPLEIGSDFLTQELPNLIESANKAASDQEAMPYRRLWFAAAPSMSRFTMRLEFSTKVTSTIFTARSIFPETSLPSWNQQPMLTPFRLQVVGRPSFWWRTVEP